ncbi:alpha/beta hydrolase [Opitutaceae bacterium TAV5]|nr:alpha/beta hydrolase [Opitutaceae bacterium TAV5]
MVSLFFRDLGGAGKPPLVLLHGLLGSSRNWQSAGGELAQAGDGVEGFHVFAPDLRNHGRSPHADGMSYAAMVGDVLRWLDEHVGRTEDGKPAPVTLLGHSMGGKVAMALACRHPERVSRLVVVDIAPKDYLSRAHRAEFAAMNELELAGLQSRGEAEMRLEARVADWAMRKFLVTNLERAEAGNGARDTGGGGSAGWRWVVNLPVLTRALPELEASPLAENERFAGPTLFITGGRSHYVRRPEDEAVIRRHFPTAEIVTLAASGHNPHMEARAEFVRAVRAAAAGAT